MAADWQWENAAAGSAAGLATVSFTHPLDVVRTRFQGSSSVCAIKIQLCSLKPENHLTTIFFFKLVNDGRLSNVPTYRNTPHALFTIARAEVVVLDE